MKRVISLVGRAKIFLRPFSRETLSSPPPGRVRLFVSFFIVVYLLWQLALPFSYYVGDNKLDERFAWRMFSAFGIARTACRIDVRPFPTSPEQRHPSDQKIFLATLDNWGPLLRKNPKPIADKLLRTQCKISPWINEILLVLKCPQDWGPERLSGYLRLNCKTGERSGSLHTP